MQVVAKTLLLLLLSASAATAAEPRISCEIVTRGPGVSITAQQQWSRILADLGIAGLTIRRGIGNEEAAISQLGTPTTPHYRVLGVLANDNLLYLPGGKFSSSDIAKLRKWFDTLREQGPEALTQPSGEFGLSQRQLEEALADLKRPVEVSTKDLKSDDAVRQLARGLKNPVELDPTIVRELAATAVADELKSLATGTALAAVLRPAGLALVPESAKGVLRYRIAKPQATRDYWPVGREPKERPPNLLPGLFESLNVEIQDTPVVEVLAVIQERLGVPLLVDRNALALHGIELSTAVANVPAKQLTYSLVLGRILTPARLRYELRVDDAAKPFIWITTVRPAG